MKKKTLFVLCFALSILLPTTFAQSRADITIENTADSLLIGDHIHVKITLKNPNLQDLAPLQCPQLDSVESLSQPSYDTILQGNTPLLNIHLTLSTYTPGTRCLPPFSFTTLRNPQQVVAQTDSLCFEVFTLQVDTLQAIKDIKPIAKQPFSIKELWMWVKAHLWHLVGLVVLAAAILLVIRWYRRRQTNQPQGLQKAEPKLPPHILALQELETLRQQHLCETSREKEYYTRLTDILRLYMEQRFGIDAPEMVSDEIIDALKSLNRSDIEYTQVQKILQTADMVKFAKAKPLPNEHELCMQYAKDFVIHTAAEEKVIEEVPDVR